MPKKKINVSEINAFAGGMVVMFVIIGLIFTFHTEPNYNAKLNEVADEFCQARSYEVEKKLSEDLSENCAMLCLYNTSLIKNQTWEYYENCVDYCLSFKYKKYTSGIYKDGYWCAKQECSDSETLELRLVDSKPMLECGSDLTILNAQQFCFKGDWYEC